MRPRPLFSFSHPTPFCSRADLREKPRRPLASTLGKPMKLLVALFLTITTMANVNAQTRRTIEFSGQSVINKLDNIFRQDIMPKLIPYSAIVSGCKEPIEKIETQIIERPDNPASNAQGQLTSGKIKERWNLSMCQREVSIYVTIEFLPDGQSTHELSTKP